MARNIKAFLRNRLRFFDLRHMHRPALRFGGESASVAVAHVTPGKDRSSISDITSSTETGTCSLSDTEEDCRAEQTAKHRDLNPCWQFTACRGGWWRIHALDGNTVMQHGDAGEPWGTEAEEHLSWYYRQLSCGSFPRANINDKETVMKLSACRVLTATAEMRASRML